MENPRSRLENLNAGARKSLSQNFLTSPHWVDRLTDAVFSGNAPIDAIWEIGPGLGALTQKLVKKSTVPVTVFEFDRKLAQALREKIPGLDLVEGDFLKQDIESRLTGKKIALLSNLPYHLSSPILFKLLEVRVAFSQLVLTFQKEYARRLIALPRTPDYGALSVLIQLTFTVESLGIIPAGAFYPKPKVDSEALRLKPLPPTHLPFETIRHVVKAAFMHRRKKLSSNLHPAFEKQKITQALGQLGINPLARPEELSPDQFVGLATLMSE